MVRRVEVQPEVEGNMKIAGLKKWTKVLVIVTGVVWLAWDIFVAVEETSGDTESRIIFEWALHFEFLAYVMAVLLTHWFVPSRRKWNIKRFSIVGGVCLLASILFQFPAWILIPIGAWEGWADFGLHKEIKDRIRG